MIFSRSIRKAIRLSLHLMGWMPIVPTLAWSGDFVVKSGTVAYNAPALIHVKRNVQISGGVIQAGAGQLIVGGNWTKTAGSFSAGTSSVTFSTTTVGHTVQTGGDSFFDVGFNGIGGGWTLQDPLVVLSTFTLANGTLDTGSSQPISIGRAWVRSGGTFTVNQSSVTFTSTATIHGSTTFQYLVATTPGIDLTFVAGTTQTIAARLTLTGTVGNPIRVRSSVAGQYAYWINSGTNSVTNVDADDNHAGGGQTIFAYGASSALGSHLVNWSLPAIPGSAVPKRPIEIESSLSGGGNTATIRWRQVTQDITDTATTITQYRIYRSTSLYPVSFSAYTQIGTTASTIFSFDDTIGGQTYFYFVVAENAVGTSAISDIVDSSIDRNRYVLPYASEATESHVVIHGDINSDIFATLPADDIEIRLTRRAGDESGPVLRSYDVTAINVASGLTDSLFSFSQTLMTLVLDYSAATPSTSLIQAVWLNTLSPTPVSAVTSATGVTLGGRARAMGTYQVRLAALSQGSFRLVPNSPRPRLLTPAKTENRRLIFIYENPSDIDVSGEILDSLGAKVRDIRPDGLSPILGTAQSMVWDVKDGQGNIVPSGVYLYKLKAGDQVFTGTVVVAR